MTDYDKIKADVDAKLKEIGVEFNARYIGETVRDIDWKCDHFRVSFGKFETDYYMGLGRRKLRKHILEKKNPYPPRTIGHEAWEKQNKIPVAPSAADVLYAILFDGEAINTSFIHWCADFGYDDDSISARNTYDACCKIGLELNKVFTHQQRAELAEMVREL